MNFKHSQETFEIVLHLKKGMGTALSTSASHHTNEHIVFKLCPGDHYMMGPLLNILLLIKEMLPPCGLYGVPNLL